MLMRAWTDQLGGGGLRSHDTAQCIVMPRPAPHPGSAPQIHTALPPPSPKAQCARWPVWQVQALPPVLDL